MLHQNSNWNLSISVWPSSFQFFPKVNRQKKISEACMLHMLFIQLKPPYPWPCLVNLQWITKWCIHLFAICAQWKKIVHKYRPRRSTRRSFVKTKKEMLTRTPIQSFQFCSSSWITLEKCSECSHTKLRAVVPRSSRYNLPCRSHSPQLHSTEKENLHSTFIMLAKNMHLDLSHIICIKTIWFIWQKISPHAVTWESIPVTSSLSPKEKEYNIQTCVQHSLLGKSAYIWIHIQYTPKPFALFSKRSHYIPWCSTPITCNLAPEKESL